MQLAASDGVHLLGNQLAQLLGSGAHAGGVSAAQDHGVQAGVSEPVLAAGVLAAGVLAAGVELAAGVLVLPPPQAARPRVMAPARTRAANFFMFVSSS